MGDLLNPTNDEQDHQEETPTQQQVIIAGSATIEALLSESDKEEINALRQPHRVWADLCKSGQVNEAIIHFTWMLEEKPSSIPVLNNLSLCFIHKWDLESALEMVNAIIALQPHSSQWYYNKGNLLFSLWRYKEAETAYEECLARNFYSAKAMNNKAVAGDRLWKESVYGALQFIPSEDNWMV